MELKGSYLERLCDSVPPWLNGCLAFFAIGASAAIGQILVLRELLALGSGNELTTGIGFALWLMGGALGSFLAASRRGSRLRDTSGEKVTFFCLLGLSGIPFFTSLSFSPLIQEILGGVPGEFLSIPALLAASALLAIPASLPFGWLFSRGVSLISGIGAGRGYGLETLGGAFAGLAFTFFFSERVSALMLAGGVAAFLALFSGFAIAPVRRQGSAPLIVLGAVLIVLLASKAPASIQELTLKHRHRGLEIVRLRESPYGLLMATREREQVSFFQNGILLFSVPAGMELGARAHLPLLSHPKPARVLLIGGSLSGLAGEVLKHPVEILDCIEVDSRLVQLASELLPADGARCLEDPRVKVHSEDGRNFVSHAATAYDVVILSLPEPSNAQINRFYTTEFFQKVRRILAKGGVLSFALPAGENYVSEAQSGLSSSIYHSLSRVFSEVRVTPLSESIFLASSETALTLDPLVLAERLEERFISSAYLDRYTLMDRLPPDRTEEWETLLGRTPAPENRDTRPIAYAHQLSLWGLRYRGLTHQRADLVQELLVIMTLCGILLWATARKMQRQGFPCVGDSIQAAVSLWMVRPMQGRESSFLPISAICISGFTGMVLTIMVLVAFQTQHGSLYREVGVLVGMFFLGTGIGSLAADRLRQRQRHWVHFLLLCLSLLSISCSILFRADQAWPFYSCNLVLGALSGLIFALCCRIAPEKSGLLYGLDLLGGAAGGLLASLVMIPLWGVTAIGVALSLICLIPGSAVMARLVLRRHRASMS